MATQTGGLFLLSAPGPDLAQDLGRVLEDMSSYYLIGYRPEWAKRIDQGRLARHHEIMRASRPGSARAPGTCGLLARTAGSAEDGRIPAEAVSSPFQAEDPVGLNRLSRPAPANDR